MRKLTAKHSQPNIFTSEADWANRKIDFAEPTTSVKPFGKDVAGMKNLSEYLSLESMTQRIEAMKAEKLSDAEIRVRLENEGYGTNVIDSVSSSLLPSNQVDIAHFN